MPAKGDQESPTSLPPMPIVRKSPPRGRVLGKNQAAGSPGAPNTPLGPTEPTLVFVPSIYGNSNYGTVYYGGQWYVLLPPIMPPPAPPTPPAGTPPFNGPYPALPPPATSSTPGLLGTLVPSGYDITPFIAEAVDYQTLFVSWTPPTGPFLDFRLVRNRYGFPVDENDGITLLDSGGAGYPGNNYFDSDVIPGTMHYYGVYILVQVGTAQVWYRAGLTAVLAVTNFDCTDIMLLDRIPEYYKMDPLGNPLELTSDFLGNSYLEQFMSVFGWGLDYLKTQIALAENVNNPNVIPVNWLVNLAATVGFPYYPETDAATMRDAVANQAYLVQSRGTLSGIEDIVTQLTGWSTDIRPGINMMLEDDQSTFLDPIYATWNPAIAYNAGEIVAWGPGGSPDYFFQSVSNVNLDNTPPTTPTSNSFWTDVYYASNSTVLTNPTTGWLNTWEPLIDNSTLQTPGVPGAFTERVGILTPPAVGIYTQNGLGLTNNSGSTSAIELRSVSRSIADIEAGLTYPTRGQVIGDGIPVPFTLPRQAWYSWVEYFPGQLVSYQGMPYLALKASTGITPPTNGIPSNEWQPVGYDARVALMLSGYTGQNLTVAGVGNIAVTPYVDWFDETGTFISSVYIRSNLSGGAPALITFDSFAQPSNWGTALATPDIGSFTWSAQVSNFVNNAYGNGAAVPATVNTRTLEIINYGTVNAMIGVTLATLPNGGWYGGLVLRWASNTSYIRVDQYAVWEISGSSVIQLTVHGTPFSAGDRMTVSNNGPVPATGYTANTIIVYRNGVEVSAVTTSFNNTQTQFGMVVDSSVINPAGTVQPNGTRLQSRRSRTRVTFNGTRVTTTNVARGAPLYPLHGPIRSTTKLAPMRGRVTNHTGAYTTTPALIPQHSQPTRARSGPGRRGVTR